MEVREVRVEVEKKVADGAYGNETIRVGFTATLGPGEEGESQLVHDLIGQAYDVILWKLKRSAADGVREALETKEEREARWTQYREQQRSDRILDRYPLEQAPSDEPLAGSGELPVTDEDSPF